MNRIIIFANGHLPDLNKAHNLLRPDDFIICADGGTQHALTLGLTPNLLIGDMDSIEKGQLEKLQKNDVEIELFSHDKDETDLELAINRAIELEPQQLLIMGALGGRLDQTLANIALLADPRLSIFDARLDDGVEEIFFCRDQVQIYGGSGDLVSLLPWGNPVAGVLTTDLKWPLKSEMLLPDKTRGISNEMLGDTASVEISSGLLLVIHTRKT